MSRPPDELDRGCRQAQLIGGMLVLALGTYASVIELIRTQRAPFSGFAPAVPLDLLRPALAVMAVLGLVAVKIVRSNVLAGRIAVRSSTSGMTPVVHRLLTASVVTLAICESIAIYGFVLFLLGGRRADFYGFAAFALLAFARYFPRRSLWEAWARQA
jgi:hypothetical protein